MDSQLRARARAESLTPEDLARTGRDPARELALAVEAMGPLPNGWEPYWDHPGVLALHGPFGELVYMTPGWDGAPTREVAVQAELSLCRHDWTDYGACAECGARHEDEGPHGHPAGLPFGFTLQGRTMAALVQELRIAAEAFVVDAEALRADWGNP